MYVFGAGGFLGASGVWGGWMVQMRPPGDREGDCLLPSVVATGGRGCLRLTYTYDEYELTLVQVWSGNRHRGSAVRKERREHRIGHFRGRNMSEAVAAEPWTPPASTEAPLATPGLEPIIFRTEGLEKERLKQVIELEEACFAPCERLGPIVMQEQAALRTSGLLLAQMCAESHSHHAHPSAHPHVP